VFQLSNTPLEGGCWTVPTASLKECVGTPAPPLKGGVGTV